MTTVTGLGNKHQFKKIINGYIEKIKTISLFYLGHTISYYSRSNLIMTSNTWGI